MEKFVQLEATACPLGLENVDTDQLIPARFMSRPRSAGYGGFLLHDLRFTSDGTSKDFVLDAPQHEGCKVLIARRNFGSGSSREAAVYALWDFGIRCVIASSFGDIFASNAVKNGMLPAQVSEADAEALLSDLSSGTHHKLSIDLEMQTIKCGARQVPFLIDPVRRLQLLNGWDDLDLTLRHTKDIGRYRTKRLAVSPWAWPKRT